MEINEVLIELKKFKDGGTDQKWIMNSPSPSINFKNDYINVLRIDSTNKAGGSSVENGKQWGIIIEIYKDFRILPNWIKLKEKLKNDIDVTPVVRGVNSGNYGIRLYKMSRNPSEKIIEELLKFIFE